MRLYVGPDDLTDLRARSTTRFADADGTPLLDEAAIVLTFQVPREAAFVAVLALTERATRTPVERLVGESSVGAVIGDAEDTRSVLFARQSGVARLSYTLEPARTGGHVAVGLDRGGRYRIAAGLRPGSRTRPAGALLTAEEEFASEVAIVPGGDEVASSAGVLRFSA